MTNERSMGGDSACPLTGLGRVITLLVGVGLGASAGGCGSTDEGSAGELFDTGSADEALQMGPGSPSIFRDGGRMVGSGGVQFNHSLDPAICDVESVALALVARDPTTQRYRVFGMNRQTLSPNWTEYGTRTFATRPACVRYQPYYPNAAFVLAGRGTNGRLYTSVAQWNLQPYSGPTPLTVWEQVGTQTYSTNGSPALATDGFNAFLTLLGDDNRLYAHIQLYPYEANDWGTRYQAPALPSGWTAQGTPAVAFTHGATGKFQIIVRARNSSNVNRLYQIYFYIDRFTDWNGNTPVWTQVTTGGYTVSSDPAFAFDWSVPTSTLYFRSGGNIIQTSGIGPELGTLPIQPITEAQNDGLTLVGAPAAQGGSGVDHGHSFVVIRSSTDNQLWGWESEAGVIP